MRLDEFLAIAYTELTVHKRHNVKEVAEAMGMAASTLYHKLKGESPMSMEERLALVRVTQNQALRDHVLEAMGITAGNVVDLPKRKGATT